MDWIGFYNIIVSVGNFFNKNQSIIDVIIVLAAIKAFGHISKVLGQPSVLGKILAGIIIGPSFLGLVTQGPLIKGLAEIGVILLMFLAGFETNTNRLLRSLRPATYSALLGVMIPLVAGFTAGLFFGYGRGESAFIGIVLVATSVSISVQVLREFGRLQSKEGFTILGAAVLDDIVGLIILSVVMGVSIGGLSTLHIGTVLLKVIVFFGTAIFIGKYFFPLLFSITAKMQVSVPVVTTCIIVALIYAVAAQYMGLAGIIGAYLAGLMVRSANQGGTLLNSLETVGYSFFIPFFFAGIGLEVTLGCISTEMMSFTAAIILIAVVSKFSGCALGALVGGLQWRPSLIVGAGMIARGEVALIIAKFGNDMGLIGGELFTVMVIMAIITTVLSPPLIRLFIRY
ncbi:cation:proton antiporter [Desulfitibacter alkalitolerans]|uniref:cation:proton antiporter n=1 Tax=Desulfitibacter alkalitolerans TaxID=264641 RepID=UPI0006884A83|nr:cation:proton antiporter [Desulfitibacter alkalitolerans]